MTPISAYASAKSTKIENQLIDKILDNSHSEHRPPPSKLLNFRIGHRLPLIVTARQRATFFFVRRVLGARRHVFTRRPAMRSISSERESESEFRFRSNISTHFFCAT